MLMGSTLHVHVQAWKETMEMRAKYDEEERNIDEDLRCATDRLVVLAAFISPLFLILQGSQSKLWQGNLAETLDLLPASMLPTCNVWIFTRVAIYALCRIIEEIDARAARRDKEQMDELERNGPRCLNPPDTTSFGVV
jgi:hypothetical protein